ncbi:MAG: lytic transglycosylase domain-containing protein [bacterium]
MADPLEKQEKRTGAKSAAGILIIVVLILFTSVTFTGNPAFPSTEGDPFPRPAELEPSIEFWKKIYTVYTTEEGVIHDSDDLTIIYEVVNLAGTDGMTDVRRKRIRRVKEKYRDILGSIMSKRGLNLNKEEERVYNLFSNKSLKRLLDAQYSIRFQLGQKDRFIQGIQLSYRYLDCMKEIIADMDLPERLIYLPHVESSFNYRAYSKFGAAGIWQFTRDTGKRYLKINNAIDERLDPIKSTHGALQHLQDNYTRIRSWPLAIIAYNYGLAGMRRAVEGLDTTDVVEIICRHKGRTFGFASRNFYCEFLAACDIAENYREYFGEIDIEEPLKFQAYRLKEDVLLKDIMKYTGLERDVIKTYNPAIRRSAILSQSHLPKGFNLKLPDDRDYQLDAFFCKHRSPKPVQMTSVNKPPVKKSVTQREQVIPREFAAKDKDLATDDGAFSITSAIVSEFLKVSLPCFTPLDHVIRSRNRTIMESGFPILPPLPVTPSKSLMTSKPFNAPLPVIIARASCIAAGPLNAPVHGVIPDHAAVPSEPLFRSKFIIAGKSVIPSQSIIASGSLNALMPGVLPTEAAIQARLCSGMSQ